MSRCLHGDCPVCLKHSAEVDKLKRQLRALEELFQTVAPTMWIEYVKEREE